MGKYEKLEKLSDEEFKRSTGVTRNVFSKMLAVVSDSEKKRKEKSKGRGRKPTLAVEEQLVVMLEYYREYRTQFHIGVDYGLDETQIGRIVKKMEDALVKSKKFKLPGKKALLDSDTTFEVILVDATESPIERPKKSKNTTIAEKRNDTR